MFAGLCSRRREVRIPLATDETHPAFLHVQFSDNDSLMLFAMNPKKKEVPIANCLFFEQLEDSQQIIFVVVCMTHHIILVCTNERVDDSFLFISIATLTSPIQLQLAKAPRSPGLSEQAEPWSQVSSLLSPSSSCLEVLIVYNRVRHSGRSSAFFSRNFKFCSIISYTRGIGIFDILSPSCPKTRTTIHTMILPCH